MKSEEIVLQRLEKIEAQLAPLAETAQSFLDLKDDLMPLMNHAFKIVIKELQDVESSFQLEDLIRLAKRGLRSVRNLVYALEQLETLIDFVTTIEPLLKSSVPQMINYLDSLEQEGVFRTYSAMVGVRAKVAKQYSPEDFELMGDAFAALLGFLKKLSKPETLSLLERLLEIPAVLDLSACKSIGPMGMLGAFYSDEVKQGLGVVIELTKALGSLRNPEQSNPSTPQ